ncbi:hypothetical protein BH11CYA1_BH11CYA1_32590 [soil metagenome]
MKTQKPVYYVPLVQIDFSNMAALYKILGKAKLAADATHKAKLEALIRKSCDTRESGAVDQTIRLLTVVLAEQPNFHRARLLRGITYNNKADYRLAIKDFDYLIEAFPHEAWFYYLRADALGELGEKGNSIIDLLAITDMKPRPRVVALNYTAQTGRIRERFEGKDENIVNLADIYYLLGGRYTELNKLPQARAAYDRCLALDDKEVQVRLARAAIFRKEGDNAAALKDLNLAILTKPKFIDAYLERAKLKETIKDPSALSDYSRVVTLGAKDPGSYLMRGEFQKRNKHFTEALNDFSQVLRLSPKEADAYIGRGESYEGLGKYILALNDYQRALSLSPEDKAVLSDRIDKLLKLTGKSRR